jgi:hypothetical protein
VTRTPPPAVCQVLHCSHPRTAVRAALPRRPAFGWPWSPTCKLLTNISARHVGAVLVYAVKGPRLRWHATMGSGCCASCRVEDGTRHSGPKKWQHATTGTCIEENLQREAAPADGQERRLGCRRQWSAARSAGRRTPWPPPGAAPPCPVDRIGLPQPQWSCTRQQSDAGPAESRSSSGTATTCVTVWMQPGTQQHPRPRPAGPPCRRTSACGRGCARRCTCLPCLQWESAGCELRSRLGGHGNRTEPSAAAAAADVAHGAVCHGGTQHPPPPPPPPTAALRCQCRELQNMTPCISASSDSG